MNRTTWIFTLLLLGWLLLHAGTTSGVYADEEKIVIAHQEIFGKLQRPPVPFPHELHMDALEDKGCGVCHHIFDKNAKALVPADGDETGCTECHKAKKKSNTPALREAYHGSCTACHRPLGKEGLKSGPVTCGECHPKRH